MYRSSSRSKALATVQVFSTSGDSGAFGVFGDVVISVEVAVSVNIVVVGDARAESCMANTFY